MINMECKDNNKKYLDMDDPDNHVLCIKRKPGTCCPEPSCDYVWHKEKKLKKCAMCGTDCTKCSVCSNVKVIE